MEMRIQYSLYSILNVLVNPFVCSTLLMEEVDRQIKLLAATYCSKCTQLSSRREAFCHSCAGNGEVQAPPRAT